MMFNCVELVTQQLCKFRATFASAVVASSCAKGRCLTDFGPVPSGATAVCMIAGGKRRHIATSSLSLFAAPVLPRFLRNDFVRGWCLLKLPADKGKTNARYLH